MNQPFFENKIKNINEPNIGREHKQTQQKVGNVNKPKLGKERKQMITLYRSKSTACERYLFDRMICEEFKKMQTHPCAAYKRNIGATTLLASCRITLLPTKLKELICTPTPIKELTCRKPTPAKESICTPILT